MDILSLNDGMMHQMDEIESRHEVQHQLIYMLDGVVILDMYRISQEMDVQNFIQSHTT